MTPQQASSSVWFYAHNKKKVGPVSWDVLREHARLGKVLTTDMILQQGDSRWVVASDIPDLFDLFPSSSNTVAPAPEKQNENATPCESTAPKKQLPVALILPPREKAKPQLPVAAVRTDSPTPGSTDSNATNYNKAVPGDSQVTHYSVSRQGTNQPGDQKLPRRFGEYELREEIARGGMGVVYKARHLKSGRIVALKMVLSGYLASAEAIVRFRVEAQAAAALDHPGIVPIYDIGEVDGQHYFTMQLVNGGSLQQWIRRSLPPPRKAAELVRQVALAVQQAHDQGVVHRDLKPQNILLHMATPRSEEGTTTSTSQEGNRTGTGPSTPEGAIVPKITDFGLAKQLHAGESLTATGEQLGTPGYMPPEQAAGNAKQVGPPSDVYGLGGVLYCLLTGRPPFQSESALKTMYMVLEKDPVAPHVLNASVSRDLETICLKCLEKKPSLRYPTANALVEDLQRYLRGEAIKARPIGRFERARRWCWRNPLSAGLVGMVCLAVVLGGSLAAHFAFRADDLAREVSQHEEDAGKARLADAERVQEVKTARQSEAERIREAKEARQREQEQAAEEAKAKAAAAKAKEEAEEKQRLAEAEKREKEKAEKRAHEELLRAEAVRYAFQLNAAQQLHKKGEYKEARLALADCHPALCHWEHSYLLEVCQKGVPLGDVFSIDCPKDPKKLGRGLEAVFSRDGQLVALIADQAIKVWDLVKRQEIGNYQAGRGFCPVAFSPDGKKLAIAQDSIEIRELATGMVVQTLKAQWVGLIRKFTSVAFTPDGRYLAVGSMSNEIRLWDVESGASVRKVAVAGGFQRGTAVADTLGLWGVTFSPDGTHVACGGHDNNVHVWDRKTGIKLSGFSGHTSIVHTLAFSPDGTRLFTGGWHGDASLRCWEVKSGRELFTLRGHASKVTGITVSSDSNRIFSVSSDQTLKVWDATTGQELLTLTLNAKGYTPVTLTPDASRFAWIDDSGLKILTALRPIERTLTGHTGTVTCVVFSPDGKHLASGSNDHSVKWWDTLRVNKPTTFSDCRFAVESISLSSDGRRLACGTESALDEGRIYDVITKRLLLTLKDYGQNLVAFSPDGKHLATCAKGGLAGGSIRDATTGRQIYSFNRRTSAHGICYSADGKWILYGGTDQSVKICDSANGRELHDLKGHEKTIRSVAYSPDGRLVASASDDRTVRVWDVDSGRETIRFSKHAGPVHGVAFSPSGRYLASGSEDKTVKVWDAKTGAEVLTFTGHNGGVTSVAFSPDGGRLASGSKDWTIKIWDLPSTAQGKPTSDK